MGTIKVKIKKPMIYYGVAKKTGSEIIVDIDKVPKLVKKGFIDAPKSKDKSRGA